MIIHMSTGTHSLENEKTERLAAVMVFSFPSLGVQRSQGMAHLQSFPGTCREEAPVGTASGSKSKAR